MSGSGGVVAAGVAVTGVAGPPLAARHRRDHRWRGRDHHWRGWSSHRRVGLHHGWIHRDGQRLRGRWERRRQRLATAARRQRQ
jgi:hypothetical protein